MLLMFLQRSGLFRRLPCLAQRLGTDAHNADSQDGEASGAFIVLCPQTAGTGAASSCGCGQIDFVTQRERFSMISTRARLAITLLLLLAAGVTFVPVAAAQTLDWNSWRRLPVLDGGRQKPFETLAREKLRAASGHVQTVDPETGECLDACTLYLGMLFDWYGWDRVGQPAGSNGQGSLHIPYPDKWDRMPLLRVDFPPLRSALGLKPEQKHISPLELSQSKIRLPDNGEDTPLLIWTATLASREQQELMPLEQKALDLAGKFRAYQDWRAGRQLMVVPQPVKTDPASTDQAWYSLSEIVGGKWDDTSDATGGLRSLQKQFREARTAYLQGSVAELVRHQP